MHNIFHIMWCFNWNNNRISGVMVSMLPSSAVDRGFEPRSGKPNDYKIGICCFSAKHTVKNVGAIWPEVPSERYIYASHSIIRLLFIPKYNACLINVWTMKGTCQFFCVQNFYLSCKKKRNNKKTKNKKKTCITMYNIK